MNRALKTIIFDLGNVIVPFDFRRGYALLEADCGIPAAEIPERLRETGLVPRFECGQIAPRDFVEQVNGALGTAVSYERFCEIWSSIFLPETLVPLELVTKLRERYRVMVLSNTNAIHFGMVQEAYPILGHVDHFILSHEVGAMKPEDAIYEAALGAAQAEAGECFFTDDIAAYVEGARRKGMQAEQFLGYEKLVGDLRRRGVEV